MNHQEYEQFVQMDDNQLFDFITEKDSSQRKWVALYILEKRKAKISSNAAIASAVAAVSAAIIAIIQLVCKFL